MKYVCLKKSTYLLSLLTLVFMMSIISCEKKEEVPLTNQTTAFRLYLADSPADYQAVVIDVQQVMVMAGSAKEDNSGWLEMPLTRKGQYNLLDFRNGMDTLLATADIPSGTVSRVLLVLGDDNYVVLKDGERKPLSLPASLQSGLKLTVSAELAPGVPYDLVLDFDVLRSIMKTDEGYALDPEVRTFSKSAGGAVEGVVLPDTANAYVLAIMNADTLSAIPDSSGYYQFWGLPDGEYRLLFMADTTTGFLNDTLNDLQVTAGQTISADTMWLHRNN